MEDFSVLAAMYEEPPYDFLSSMKFTTLDLGDEEVVYELDRDLYRGFVVSDNRLELFIKNKRGLGHLIHWLKFRKPKIEMTFTNFHRNAAIVRCEVADVCWEGNLESIKIIFVSDRDIKIEYTNKEATSINDFITRLDLETELDVDSEI